MPISRSRTPADARLEPRPLPSIGFPRLRRYYGPLRHPTRPRTSLAGCELKGTPLHHVGLPVLHPVPCACMPSPLPRRDRWRLRSSSPAAAAFPESQAGGSPLPATGARVTLFGACSAFTHVTACTLAKSPMRPSAPKAPVASLPPQRLRAHCVGTRLAGAAVARRVLLPLRASAFSRHAEKCGLGCDSPRASPLLRQAG